MKLISCGCHQPGEPASLDRLIPALTSCMPYTVQWLDHLLIRLSTCQYHCPLGTVIDRC
jgi:hypothetical protein